MWSLQKKRQKPKVLGCNNRSIWNRSIKILAAEGVLAVRGGNPDRMIPKQNAGFRIYVVMGQNSRIGLPQI